MELKDPIQDVHTHNFLTDVLRAACSGVPRSRHLVCGRAMVHSSASQCGSPFPQRHIAVGSPGIAVTRFGFDTEVVEVWGSLCECVVISGWLPHFQPLLVPPDGIHLVLGVPTDASWGRSLAKTPAIIVAGHGTNGYWVALGRVMFLISCLLTYRLTYVLSPMRPFQSFQSQLVEHSNNLRFLQVRYRGMLNLELLMRSFVAIYSVAVHFPAFSTSVVVGLQQLLRSTKLTTRS